MSEEDQELDQLENDQVEETTEQTEEVEESVEDSTDEQVLEKPEPVAERPVYTMPVSKAQEEKKRAVEKAREEARQEAEAQMQKLKDEYETKLRSTNPTSYEAKLEQVAKEHGLDPSAAKSLLDVFKEAIPVPDMTKYDRIVKEKEIEGYKSKVSNDFDESVLPLLKQDFPEVSDAHIRDVKAKVMELAFTEGYNTYRVEDIYRVKKDQFEFKNRMSAEPSGGRSSEMVSFKKLSDTEEIQLADSDPQAYAKYVKWSEGQESRYST